MRSYALIVYDFKNDKSHRIEGLSYFHPDPTEGDLFYEKEGIAFHLDVGILALSLGKRKNRQG